MIARLPGPNDFQGGSQLVQESEIQVFRPGLVE